MYSERVSPVQLASQPGWRYCIYRGPQGAVSRGSVLYVHPFAEEMNKSRRMASLQARRFSAHGYGVLQVDLLGCGDSSGDFGDASWAAWLSDLEAAWRWLRTKTQGPMHIWGLRLGVLLAAEFTRQHPGEVASIIGWQPVASGELFLGHFMRLVSAAEMLTDGRGRSAAATLLQSAKSGESVEVAGYTLSASLVRGILAARLDSMLAPGAKFNWLEIGAQEKFSPASRRTIEALRQAEVDVQVRVVEGEPFWTTAEIAECPELCDATMDLMRT